jgi:hypothetical protein
MIKTQLVIALGLSFLLSGCYFWGERRGLEGKSSSPMSGSSTNNAASGELSLSITDMYFMDVNAAPVPPNPQPRPSSVAAAVTN